MDVVLEVKAAIEKAMDQGKTVSEIADELLMPERSVGLILEQSDGEDEKG